MGLGIVSQIPLTCCNAHLCSQYNLKYEYYWTSNWNIGCDIPPSTDLFHSIGTNWHNIFQNFRFVLTVDSCLSKYFQTFHFQNSVWYCLFLSIRHCKKSYHHWSSPFRIQFGISWNFLDLTWIGIAQGCAVELKKHLFLPGDEKKLICQIKLLGNSVQPTHCFTLTKAHHNSIELCRIFKDFLHFLVRSIIVDDFFTPYANTIIGLIFDNFIEFLHAIRAVNTYKSFL